VEPTHNGPLLLAVGVVGIVFTTSVVVPAELVQPFTVSVTEYVPALAVVTLPRDGF
jgi:hypothetical protein